MKFQTRYGHHYFLVMYFGLNDVAAAFMDLINGVFQSYLDSFVIVFIDDILLYQKNEGQHMNHLSVVLQVLKENQVFAKHSYCKFCSVAFINHNISSQGVEVDPRITEAARNWPRPLTASDIKSFFGLEVNYRRFVVGFTSFLLL